MECEDISWQNETLESQIIHLDIVTVSSNTDTTNENYDGTKYMAQEKAPSLLQWNDFKNSTQSNQADSVASRDKCCLLAQEEKPHDEITEADNHGRQISGLMPVTKVFMILLSSYLSNAMNIQPPTENDQSLSKIQTFVSLSTPNCNPSNLNMTCPFQGSDNMELLITRCEFKKMCFPGYTPVCINIEEGMTFICAPINLRCEKGHWWKVRKDEDDPSKVKIIVEKCPTDYFQETNSNCINACKSKHLGLTNIEEKYLIYSEGNHIYPTYMYCNYKEGYYNRAGRFLLDYDRESEHEPYFCSGNAEMNNPCVKTQKPLPNGTCVLPCNPYECRDDYDNFICKQTCWDHLEDGHSITVTVTDKQPDLDTDIAECDREPWVCENGICKQSFNGYVCQCYPGFVNDRETGRCIGSDVTPKTNTLATEIIVLIVICVTFGVCLMTIIVAFCIRKKCKAPSDGAEDGNSSSRHNSSADTVELSSVDESNNSDDLRHETDQKKQSIVFKGKSTNVYITNHFNTDGTKDNLESTFRTKEEDQNYSTSKTDSACEIELEDSNEQIARPLGMFQTVSNNAPFTNDFSEEEKEHLLANSSYGDAKLNLGEFKKDTDDTNTQAATNCLNQLLRSCGAIIHSNKVMGSAFRVGRFYVMTSFHVLRKIVRDQTGSTYYDFSRIEQEELGVNFNESIMNPHRRRFSLKYRYHDEEYDFAILEIKNIELHENLPDPLLLWKHDSYYLFIEEVILIGYGNKKNENEKHWEICKIIEEDTFNRRHREALASLEQNAQEYKNDIPGHDKSSVDRGYHGLDNELFIKFDCFMEHGLSGGPVITKEVNSPKVIGIVKGGQPDFYYKLSERKRAAFDRKHLFEVGVKMHLIHQKMLTQDPALASEIFPKD
ncbi:uncharacterized protein LOC132720279 isoform X2 [Ruditapes philippinarum]|uniref:uncharacterized protein LOC132720279 isoform X2 n=1 Tax=Ruditapes philippinarum TaxID=129788 RepID=UPI00295AA56B|nr:uncharacterized protein LOC132720279 isoform X2 [Ruditapes philippinarum]